MEGLVKEYANFLNDDKKPASERFWELEKRIKEDKRHPGVVMELKKSEVIWDIVRLIRLKVMLARIKKFAFLKMKGFAI